MELNTEEVKESLEPIKKMDLICGIDERLSGVDGAFCIRYYDRWIGCYSLKYFDTRKRI